MIDSHLLCDRQVFCYCILLTLIYNTQENHYHCKMMCDDLFIFRYHYDNIVIDISIFMSLTGRQTDKMTSPLGLCVCFIFAVSQGKMIILSFWIICSLVRHGTPLEIRFYNFNGLSQMQSSFYAIFLILSCSKPRQSCCKPILYISYVIITVMSYNAHGTIQWMQICPVTWYQG